MALFGLIITGRFLIAIGAVIAVIALLGWIREARADFSRLSRLKKPQTPACALRTAQAVSPQRIGVLRDGPNGVQVLHGLHGFLLSTKSGYAV